MAVSLANGSEVAIAATYDNPVAVTAASNANPCVLTCATETYAVGDVIEITSGWGNLTGQVAQVTACTGTSVTLGGIDTTDTTRFPALNGVGSVRKVLTWQSIEQITAFASSGGDQQTVTYQPLNAQRETALPTVQNSVTITLTIANDEALPQTPLLKSLTQAGAPVAMRFTRKDGAVRLYNGYPSLSSSPTAAVNAIETVQLWYGVVANINSYAAP